ncbi:4'-phosphopantetheinyl transferase superfamily protein [Streptomyces sp. NPDC002588]|uniref:4'-phosphopantetheinyl transferase family protein n=1 Tax=Streptomyces sp. NPDC002588 TaxID=3154419 RepID=UPI0033215284
MTIPPVRTLPPTCWARTPAELWEVLRDDLETCGVGLVQASLRQWRLNRPDEDRLRRLLGRDLTRYQATDNETVRERFAASRALLRCAVGAAVGMAPEHVEIGYHLSGRPFVRGCDQVDISLSHTAHLLFVGVTSLGRIGVDAESADRAPSVAELDRHICTPSELRAMDGIPPEGYEALVLQRWILKEAYSKALGQGLHFPFTEFGFEVRGGLARLCHKDGARVEDPTWTFHNLPRTDGHQAAVALQDLRAGHVGDTRVGTAVDLRTARALWGDRTA